MEAPIPPWSELLRSKVNAETLSAASSLLGLSMRPRLFGGRPDAHADTALDSLRALLDASNSVLCIVDSIGIVRGITPNAERVLGNAAERAAELELSVVDLLQADHPYEVQVALDELVRGKYGQTRTWTFRTRSPQAEPRWVEVVGTHYESETRIAGIFLEVRDVTANFPTQQRHEVAGQALENSPDAVIITSAQGFIEYVNPAFEKLTGYRLTELRGRTPSMLKSDRHAPEFYQRMWNILRAGEVFRGEIANRRKSGEVYYEDLVIEPIRNADGVLTHYVSMGRDISAQKRAEENAAGAAFYDPVTGISTFELLRERSRQILALARRHGHTSALVHIDISGLRSVNSSLGTDVGDQLLRKFAERLKQGLRESDTIARLREDEFLILLSDVAEEDATARVVRRLRDSVMRPFQIREHSINVGANFGVALYPQDATTFDEMLEYSGLAMKRAQDTSTGYEFFRKEITEITLERLSLEDDLRWAWDRKQFVLRYQPVIAAASGRVIGAEALTRARIMGVEALARWPHLERGEISPAQFIPVAERTGRIVAIDRWALATAIRQGAVWSQEGWKGWVSVNLSARSLHDSELPSYIQRCIEAHNFDPSRLVLEITESAAMRDTAITARILAQLKLTGAMIALDDFGTGHSSLAYLKMFPVDLLKLDHAFIHGIGVESKQEHLIETMITYAHRIGAQVVAEGVEEEHQFDWLKEAGCDFVQGYLLGAPQPPEDVFGAASGD